MCGDVGREGASFLLMRLATRLEQEPFALSLSNGSTSPEQGWGFDRLSPNESGRDRSASPRFRMNKKKRDAGSGPA